jgi:hypothetical protein
MVRHAKQAAACGASIAVRGRDEQTRSVIATMIH